jgi:ABC-2 type transport system ATP-binding protein
VLGVAPQELALYEDLTAEDNLISFGEIFGLSGKGLRARVSWCLEFVELQDARRSRVAVLSGGMKRRLNLAVALVHDPAVVLLDEPTVGVDPQSRNHIFENVQALARAGKAVVYTTHYMEEVERLCRRAAIIDRGRLAACDTIDGLLALAQQARRVRLGWDGPPPGPVLLEQLQGRFGPQTLQVEGPRVQLAFAGEVPYTALVAWLAEQGWPVKELGSERSTLEDAFLKLTGRQLRDR